MKRITIYPNHVLLEKLVLEANNQQRSLNNLIIRILTKHFKEVTKNDKENNPVMEKIHSEKVS